MVVKLLGDAILRNIALNRKTLLGLLGFAVILYLLWQFQVSRLLLIMGVMMAISYGIGHFGITLTYANIGISFTKFMIMVLMYWFSIPTAMVVGVILYLVEFFGQNYWNSPILIIIPNVLLMPIYGSWLTLFDIRLAGIALLIISNIIESVGTLLLGKNPGKVIMYYFTNVLFNIPIFLALGPLLT